jgi:hypothetical protein
MESMTQRAGDGKTGVHDTKKDFGQNSQGGRVAVDFGLGQGARRGKIRSDL